MNPLKLSPYGGKPGVYHVVIETPRYSRNKISFDAERKAFCLKKPMPKGLQFPYDFGFIPGTGAEDGNPLDVLLIADSPLFTGCLVEARVIGALKAEESKGAGKTFRNDKVFAVASESIQYENLYALDGLNKQILQQIMEFFAQYSKLSGKSFTSLGLADADEAQALIEKLKADYE